MAKRSRWHKQKDIGNEFGGLGFVGGLLIGLGIGLLYGRPDAGVLIGVGVGFLLMMIIRMHYHYHGKK